jgi:hypothetical protein
MMDKDFTPRDANAATMLRHLTPSDWARFGAEELAYIRPVVIDGAHVVAIHSADGKQIGAAPDASLATAAILQHEMVPLLVH